MRRRARRFAILALTPLAAAAGALPQGPGVIGAACPGPGAAEILLLPEDAGRMDAPGLLVTAAYTGTDARDGDLPKPVGIFVDEGEAVNLELARMDGLLVVERDGAARIEFASDVRLGEARHDLGDIAERRAFAQAAAAAGVSALQSHLLIRDGRLDLRPAPNAPLAVRRILFQTESGALGVWQSGSRPLTLHAAAEELLRAQAPVMALNLDMGSHDFCERDGRSCGFVQRSEAGKLSNLLRLALSTECP